MSNGARFNVGAQGFEGTNGLLRESMQLNEEEPVTQVVLQQAQSVEVPMIILTMAMTL